MYNFFRFAIRGAILSFNPIALRMAKTPCRSECNRVKTTPLVERGFFLREVTRMCRSCFSF